VERASSCWAGARSAIVVDARALRGCVRRGRLSVFRMEAATLAWRTEFISKNGDRRGREVEEGGAKGD
jgi:hypothetical protein